MKKTNFKENRGEMVLLYHLNNTEKGRKIKGVLIQMGVRIKTISTDMISQKVGYLAGIKGIDSVEGSVGSEEFPEEMLVMKGFTSSRIDWMLNAFRRAGVEKVDLKAIITDENQNWTFEQLCQEIKKEHEEMSKDKQ